MKNMNGKKPIKSCGCYTRLKLSIRRKNTIKHGKINTQEYNSWKSMKRRCKDNKGKGSHRYFGRGITVCKRWLNSFENFYEDMGPKPGKEYSIERINNAGNYEPGNCVWATPKEQGRNRENNRLFNINGIEKTLPEWSEITGVKLWILKRRIYIKQIAIEEAIFPIDFNGIDSTEVD